MVTSYSLDRLEARITRETDGCLILVGIGIVGIGLPASN
jgi:hypothetical protein